MNLDDLRAAQVDERGTDSLQPLPATFYDQAAAYLAELRGERDRLAAAADDPFDSEAVRQRTDELETAAEVVEAVYERRVGKLVKRASLAAAGMPADDEGLTEEEQGLFADLVDRIETHRHDVLESLATGDDRPVSRGGTATPTQPGESDDVPEDAPVDARSVPAVGEEPDVDAARDATAEPADETGRPSIDGEAPTDSAPDGDEAPEDEERVTVRVTTDVGEIYGVDDRVYTLGAEDVVRLPTANAKPLLDGGAAQRLE